MQTNKTTILYTVCGGFGKGEAPAGVYKNCGGNPGFVLTKRGGMLYNVFIYKKGMNNMVNRSLPGRRCCPGLHV